ncbi:DUF6783 domain-containing protein [Eisenbergiella massiliensis]|uniref:DUF6783 domain-containing protein n=1 Tax=Eisenbergiella TaxID=1432051 RepID=UPI0039927209
MKIAFCRLCVSLCGRFVPNEGGIAGYVDRIWGKSTAKWDVQTTGMNFRIRSSVVKDTTQGPAFLYDPYSNHTPPAPGADARRTFPACGWLRRNRVGYVWRKVEMAAGGNFVI